ncbi:MAG: hypothetical protein UW94_C0012G0002 [Parcubacteria group bacterium GW2011_GWA2_45_14]|nr:MAG: hypothetical protein UW94_C0012G0002 [Parcubacteria group bacterium GW2011_GWA2_45_14]
MGAISGIVVLIIEIKMNRAGKDVLGQIYSTIDPFVIVDEIHCLEITGLNKKSN